MSSIGIAKSTNEKQPILLTLVFAAKLNGKPRKQLFSIEVVYRILRRRKACRQRQESLDFEANVSKSFTA